VRYFCLFVTPPHNTVCILSEGEKVKKYLDGRDSDPAKTVHLVTKGWP
jgi:hypothetical protein